MEERLLHHAWMHTLFNVQDLHTTQGEPIQIIDRGRYNEHEGPDFLESTVQIGTMRWHGAVEIHTKASDWLLHGHDSNPHYKNVILHVCYEEDKIIENGHQGQRMPTLELKDRIPFHVYSNYEKLNNLHEIPCHGQLHEVVDSLRWASWSDRLLAERLSTKSERIQYILERNSNNWGRTFFIWLAYGFGLKQNAENMMRLAEHIPEKYFSRYVHDDDIIHAMCYGAGYLLHTTFQDDWPSHLQQLFTFLQKKHTWLTPQIIQWSRGRMRPVSFPKRRISQFINVYSRHSDLLSTILEQDDVQVVKNKIQGTAHAYWATHSNWDVPSKTLPISMGNDFVLRIILNVCAPFLYYYGQRTQTPRYCERAIAWLQDLPKENNAVTRRFAQEGLTASHAADTQALYHLMQSYCYEHRCLDCAFGYRLIRKQ